MKIDTSAEKLFEYVKKSYGEEKADEIQFEYANASPAAKESFIQGAAK